MNIQGSRLSFELFGGAGPISGVVLRGLPTGEEFDFDILKEDLSYRAPGTTELGGEGTSGDPVISQGLTEGRTNGAPLCVLIPSGTEEHASPPQRQYPRPGTWDLALHVRYGGLADLRDSGRFNPALVALGSACTQILKRQAITIFSQLIQVGEYLGDELSFDMKREILDARASGDSVGGVVECTVKGLPPGLGGHDTEGLESRIAGALFALPGVRGVEFGDGFAIASLRGSAANDLLRAEQGRVRHETNRAGGLIDGYTNGSTLILRCAFRATPTINREQNTVDLETLENATLRIRGRNDPCLAPRAIPYINALVGFWLLDAMLAAESGE